MKTLKKNTLFKKQAFFISSISQKILKVNKKERYKLNKLREIRESKGLSQTELAERVGVAQSMIYQIENNIRPISIPILLSSCQILDCTPNDLLGFSKKEQ